MAEVVIVRECKHGQVRVLFGNITTVEGDIMVIPANNRLAGREGLDERMQLAAGPELRDFCTNIAKERRKENLQPCGVGGRTCTCSARGTPSCPKRRLSAQQTPTPLAVIPSYLL